MSQLQNQTFRLAFLICPLLPDPLSSRLALLSLTPLVFVAVDHASSLLPDPARLVFWFFQKVESKEPENYQYKNQTRTEPAGHKVSHTSAYHLHLEAKCIYGSHYPFWSHGLY